MSAVGLRGSHCHLRICEDCVFATAFPFLRRGLAVF